jgi:hypothetical protein
VSSAGTAVVHLVRAANGLEPFERFLESYARNPSGADHDLVLLLKGFDSAHGAREHLAVAGEMVAATVLVDDAELDLAAYAIAARRLEHDRLCYLNSFSVVEAPRWLELLGAPHSDPKVGMVGATGSWGSLRSYSRFMLGLRGPYAGVFADRRATVATLNRLNEEPSAGAAATEARRIPVLSFLQALAEQSHGFLPFPARHLRTNAFMIDRDVLLALRTGTIRRKSDAYRLESGRESLTMQLEQQGLEVLVVGRNGQRYGPTEWAASGTFWQGAQENLLIADKQTGRYRDADRLGKEALSRYAWGRPPAVASPDAVGAMAG